MPRINRFATCFPLFPLRLCGALLLIALAAAAQQPRIYWADEVPKDWNGKWAAKFQTVPEKTGYTRTTSSLDLLEFVDMLKWSSFAAGSRFRNALRTERITAAFPGSNLSMKS